MTQTPENELKKFKFFHRISMIQLMLIIAVAGILLTVIADYYQL